MVRITALNKIKNSIMFIQCTKGATAHACAVHTLFNRKPQPSTIGDVICLLKKLQGLITVGPKSSTVCNIYVDSTPFS